MNPRKEKRVIFFRKDFSFQNEINLLKNETEHLRSLRVYKEDKTVEFRDGNGKYFLYEILSDQKEGMLIDSGSAEDDFPFIPVATAIPKGNRLDWLVQKGTETGISHFYFIHFKRSVRKDMNLERLEKIVQEAASQSDRMFLPVVTCFGSLKEFMETFKDQIIILHPGKERIKNTRMIRDMIPVIGPEGGLDDSELNLIKDHNLPVTSLGNQVLRIETACIYIACVKNFLSFFEIEK